jgi:hypothetical protein
MGEYRILLCADSHRGAALDTETRPIDLLCVSNPRSFPPADLRRKFDPQVVVYAQGKPIQTERSGQIIFLNEQGAVTLALCGDALKLQTFRGGQFIFRKRN